MNYNKYSNKLDEAIDVRESGNLKKSRKLFEVLLKNIESETKSNLSNDFQLLYTTIKAEFVIQYRLEAKKLTAEAFSLGKELLEYDEKKMIGNPLSLRSVSNTLIDSQGYEKAVKYLTKMIPMYKNNSARKGDTRAHLAYCFFRSGHVAKAEKMIDQAIEEIVQNSSKEKHFQIFRSHALMVKALIYNSKDQASKSLMSAEKALEMAKKSASSFRVKQAEEIIKFLKEKN